MNRVDTAVIGAGPAGLMAAIAATNRGRKVCLIEKKNRPGRKLLLAGSGRCNLTHSGSVDKFFSRYAGRERFVKPVLYSFPPEELKCFFKERGVPLKKLNDGKIFPCSEKSSDVLEVFLKEVERLDIDFRTGTSVEKIELPKYDEDSGRGFLIYTESGTVISAFSLIIAAGGASYPGTGSNGDGFRIAENLGHKIISPKPGLVPINIPDSPFLNLSGISIQAELAIYKDGKLFRRASGDLLFTHKGFSGPLILDNSRYLDSGDSIEMNFTGMSPEDLKNRLTFPESAAGGRQVRTIIQNLGVPGRLVTRVLETAEIPAELRLAELGKKKISLIVRLLTSHSFTVGSTGGWNEAMVTCGGVDLPGVSPKTMESRVVPGLYFAGEILDIDGDEGGFNLQFAFSSGYLAGISAASRLG